MRFASYEPWMNRDKIQREEEIGEDLFWKVAQNNLKSEVREKEEPVFGFILMRKEDEG